MKKTLSILLVILFCFGCSAEKTIEIPNSEEMVQTIVDAELNSCRIPEYCEILEITKETEDFIEVKVSIDDGSGSMDSKGTPLVMFKKESGYTFIRMYEENEGPECSLMEQFEVPKSFYGKCSE